MNRKEHQPEEMLDSLIADIRDERVEDHVVEAAGRRVWDRISPERAPARFSSCQDFQALMQTYRDGTLAPGKRMLVEDHSHHCVACRKALMGEQAAVPAPVVEMPRRRMTPARWMGMAASFAVAALVGGWAYQELAPAPPGTRATLQAANGAVYRLDQDVLQPVSAGAEFTDRQILRTAAGSTATLRLFDGSTVEVGERSEVSVSATRRDTRIGLERGALIVQAAKRRKGHLYVASLDSRVSVTGTLFSVNRGSKGTRVSVMEGEVVVERNNVDKILHAGDQLATHRSMQPVAIRDEIAWSPRAEAHYKTLQQMLAIKDDLQSIRMPGIRYQSRLLDAIPADAVVVLSVPNMRDAIRDAQKLFTSEVARNGVKVDAKFLDFADRVARLSDYLGEEFMLTGVHRGTKITGVLIADVHRPGLRQFIEAEAAKANETKIQVVDSDQPIRARQSEELLVKINGSRVAVGLDESLVNAVAQPQSGFASTGFGQRIQQSFNSGTGILLAIDLQRMMETHVGEEKVIASRFGGDGMRYLIAEQKTFSGRTQHSAVLNFDGERHGLASWLGQPGPMGGLSFVSPQAQLAASFITKDPRQIIDELFALMESKGPDSLAELDRVQQLTGVNIKQDIAGSLGSEATFAMDGPVVPVPSWKLIVEVNQADRLQTALEKLVAGLNSELQKRSGGATITSEVVQLSERKGLSAPVTVAKTIYTIHITAEKAVPDAYYTYSDGYLVAGASKNLVLSALNSRQSGTSLNTSDTFRRLLPTDQNANFSGLMYQNAAEAARLLSSAAPQDGPNLAEIAEKIGPALIGVYATADRIEVTTFGNSMDLLMQNAMVPMFRDLRVNGPQKHRTTGKLAAYR